MQRPYTYGGVVDTGRVSINKIFRNRSIYVLTLDVFSLFIYNKLIKSIIIL
jgi:hypothetical protein